MSGMQITLPEHVTNGLAPSMFVRFFGPTAEQITSLGSSELHALVDWWAARGLAVWRTHAEAQATLNVLYRRLRELNNKFQPLPWVADARPQQRTARQVTWWPTVGMETPLRIGDPPSRVVSPYAPPTEGKELLETLAMIAASGAHHLVVVDNYLGASRGRHPMPGEFLRNTLAPTLRRMTAEGRSLASLTTITSDNKAKGVDADALRNVMHSIPRYRQVTQEADKSSFHDRFIMILADDRAMQFKGNPTVACILLGNGVDTLRGGPSIASVARLPPSACASLAATVTSLIARST